MVAWLPAEDLKDFADHRPSRSQLSNRKLKQAVREAEDYLSRSSSSRGEDV
jgi:hypothetical protein